MPSRPPRHRAPHAPTAAQRAAQLGQAHDARRRRNQPWRAWYGLAAWRGAREAQLTRQPLCERHLARGEVEPATVVHHRVAHRGAWALFLDPANHESACKACHDGEIQREERSGSSPPGGGGGSKVACRALP